MQSDVNLSPGLNSLLAGNLTGNFIDSGPIPRFWCSIGERIQWFAAKFPTQWSREFFSRSREFFGANRELNRWIREAADLNRNASRASPQASINFFRTRVSRSAHPMKRKQTIRRILRE